MLTDTLETIANTLRGVQNEERNQEMIADLLQQISDNIMASTGHPGISELATDAEAIAGTALDKVLTASNLSAFQVNSAFASDAEALAKTVTNKALKPSNLAALGATETFAGLVEIATDVEAVAETATDKVLVASNLAALGASETFAGLVELATTAEAIGLEDTARALTAAGLAAVFAALANDIVFAAGKGPVLESPDETLYRIKVADGGALTTEAVV